MNPNMNYGSLKLYTELFGQTREEVFLSYYDAPHRFYHTAGHLLRNMELMNSFGKVDEEYVVANLFHDIMYDPRRKDNEERSVSKFLHHAKPHALKNRIADIILGTGDHKEDNPLNRAEMWDLKNRVGLYEIREVERQIFKEFQYLPIYTFIINRLKFLQDNASEHYFIKASSMQHYNVAVYPGSFNPIHIGHQSVVEQAEQIFDKVIIAQGVNPGKSDSPIIDPEDSFPFHSVLSYSGLLPEFIADLERDCGRVASFTVIRGLRNGDDLSYETNQLEFMRQMKPDIRMLFIPCDKKREHISSSAIRSLQQFSKEKADRYLVKKYRYET